MLAFLHPLPVTVLWGVGQRTAEPLRRLGVRTIGDLASIPLEALRRAIGSAAAEHLADLAAGRDPRPVSLDDVEKSISADHTTEVDLTEVEQISHELLRLADEVGRRLRDRSMVARTIGIKIRFADFRTVTRVRTLDGWVDSGRRPARDRTGALPRPRARSTPRSGSSASRPRGCVPSSTRPSS